MAYIQSFETFNSGDVNGQDSWTGATEWDREGTTVQAGTYGIACNYVSDWPLITREFDTPETSGYQSFYCRVPTTTGTWGAIGNLYNQSGSLIMQFKMKWNGQLVWDNGDYSDDYLQTFSANTWYKVEMRYLSNGKVQIDIDDGTTTSAERNPSNSWTTVDKIGFQAQKQSYIDTLDGSTPTASFIPSVVMYN